MDGIPARFSTKAELLDEIIAERKLLIILKDRIVREHGRRHMTLPLLHDGWSFKDSVAHITEWELAMIKWLQASLRGETPDRPLSSHSEEQLDGINAKYYQTNKHKPLGQVVDESNDSYILVLDTIRSVTEEDLFDPGRFAWLDGKPFWPLVADSTCWHYKEHRLIWEEML